jgi:hypothetical protein
MPPVECPTTVTRVIPSEASSARVFPASSWKVYWWCAGFVDLQNPIWWGGNDAKARFGEDRDGVLPGRRAEILAVQEHDGAAVRRRRLHVHVRHLHGLALRGEGEIRYRPRIFEPFKSRTVSGLVVGCERRPRRRRHDTKAKHGQKKCRAAHHPPSDDRISPARF